MVNSLVNALENKSTESQTENGALTYSTSLNANLDWFAMGSALRSRGDSEVIDLFSKAFIEDKTLALKNLFYTRDVRGGQGERRVFRDCLGFLGENYEDDFIRILPLISEYGRWDDVVDIFNDRILTPKSLSAILTLISNQIEADLKSETPSLLAKWMPSENTSSKATRRLAVTYRGLLGLDSKEYRKMLSKLRAKIKLVEQDMSAKKWDEIDYSKLPSKANLLYSKAFFKHDEARYKSYISDVKSGKAKINAGTIYPYEIVGKYFKCGRPSDDETLNVLWKSLPDYFNGRTENAICVVDTSGSMTGCSGSVSPISVAISLGLYTAEHNKGAFRNTFMTFSERPTFQMIKGKDLFEKVINLNSAAWGGSTNIQAVFDLILDVMKKPSTKKEDLPSRIYIISDMEFNSCTEGNTNFETIKEKYSEAGFEMPQLFFWNVDARNDNLPVRFDESGVGLISGCSPAIFKNIVGSADISPIGVMLEVLNSERYKNIS